jgi:hypothetical protein
MPSGVMGAADGLRLGRDVVGDWEGDTDGVGASVGAPVVGVAVVGGVVVGARVVGDGVVGAVVGASVAGADVVGAGVVGLADAVSSPALRPRQTAVTTVPVESADKGPAWATATIPASASASA